MTTATVIEPITKVLEVEATPARAFEVFTQRIGSWWPLASHSISAEAEGAPARSCVMEPWEGGRVFETSASGQEADWGQVLAYLPGERVVFTWHLSRPPSAATEVEVTFEALDEGATRVTLVHRHWENFGETGAETREGYNEGWDHVFGERYLAAL